MNDGIFGCDTSKGDATTNPSAAALCFASMRQSLDAMCGETLQRRVTITNPQGFHLRPQSVFVQKAKHFASEVVVARGDLRVNGKNLLELMLLSVEPGTELILEATGPDAAAAVEALTEILAASSVEEKPLEPPLPKKG